jgi:formylglycine-generating enzyme required for sulfatase activity
VPLSPRKPILLWLGLIFLAAGGPGLPACADADPAEAPRKAGDLAFWEELAFWETIKNSQDPAEFEAYLIAYPKGRFARLAEIRIRSLKAESDAASPVERTSPGTDAGEESTATRGGERHADAGKGPGKMAGAANETPGATFQECDDCPLMVVIPAGRYIMGSNRDRPEEKPRHAVSFERPFAIGVYEVTMRQWDVCLREGGCSFSPKATDEARLPVSNLSWEDAQEYVRWLTKKTGHEYRLPTEAEWEYAASGGKSTSFWWGNDVGKANANCRGCGSAWDGKRPAPAGSFEPNPFGLHDVHGNLWEWVLDCVNRSYKGAPTDGSAWLRGDCIGRGLRGGSWNLDPDYMRTTRRHHYDRDVRYYLHGFRVVRPLP